MEIQPDINSLAEKWLNGNIAEAERKELDDWYNCQPGINICWQKDDSEEELKKELSSANWNLKLKE